MGKIKIPRKSTHVDMTAMVDMAFLLVTFFMLTTKFRPDEAVIVDTPKSISDVIIPDQVIMITVDSTGRIFYGLDGQKDRLAVIDRLSTQYNIKFSEEEREQFKLMSSFGVPIGALPALLQMAPAERNGEGIQTGIPCDSAKNELKDWILAARANNSNLRIAIKGDGKARYPVIKQVIKTLQDQKVNRFNLITDLEAAPADMPKK